MEIIGIGNAIVDILTKCDDALLEKLGLEKGTMQLADKEQAAAIYEAIGPTTEMSGGSVANSCAILAHLGISTGFVGAVADDSFGNIFAHDLQSVGVHNLFQPQAHALPTATSIVLVTPDAQRTMNTHLGCSGLVDASVMNEESLSQAGMVYLEGYLFDSPTAREAMEKAVTIMRQTGGKVALSLSDPFCVERHRDMFWGMITGDAEMKADVVFANEMETESLFGCRPDSQLLDEQIVAHNITLFATHGAEGVEVLEPNNRMRVAAWDVEEVVDTTGAGDAFAAGVLAGLIRQYSAEHAARLGTLCAASVLGQMGARTQENLKLRAEDLLLL
tara:strand:- start:656 stop:1651 length:996 start_codon:yes stop_codon:yes gene_type:complete